jgi:formylglycine-generating enzyme required for sulfatase activity
VEMVLVPVGCFMMGNIEGELDEQPIQRICIEQPFWLDKYEVSNSQFAQFEGQASHEGTWTEDNYPRENIYWFEARNYCRSRRGRLPTEAEWEYAARGPDNWKYPWGDNYDGRLANDANNVDEDEFNRIVAPVTLFENGASWVGAYQLSGNVWEWVSSIYAPYPYDAERETNLDAISARVIRGGSYQFDRFAGRTSDRKDNAPNQIRSDIGFRCVRDYEA